MARLMLARQSYILASEQFAMNQSNGKFALPTWLDGRTIAMLTTTITVALTLGTMMQTAHSHLGGEIGQLRQDMNGMRQEFRQDMNGMRQELRADIEKARADLSNDINKLDDRVDKIDDRLRLVEVGVTAIQTTMVGFDTRLRVVEQHPRRADETPDPYRNDG